MTAPLFRLALNRLVSPFFILLPSSERPSES